MATIQVQKSEEIPSLSHRRLIEIGKAENSALARLLSRLDGADWSRPTDCARWDVKDVVAHIVGMAQGFTRFSELRRQLIGAKKRKGELGNQLNAMNEIQVEDRKHLTPAELLEQLGPTMDRFIKLRDRVGRPGKFIPMYDSSILGLTNVRYLLDSIFPRDIFMHRIDITRATGKPFEFIPEDVDLVTDIVRDWARRTKADVSVELTGEMQARFQVGDGSGRVVGDAVQFCRVLSGRADPGELDLAGASPATIAALERGVPF